MEPKFLLMFSYKQMQFRVDHIDNVITANLRLMPSTLDWALLGTYTIEAAAMGDIPKIAQIKGLVFSHTEGKWKQAR